MTHLEGQQLQQIQEQEKQLEEIRALIREHQGKQNYSQGFGTPAQLVKSVLREYEDKTTKAYSDVKHFRDDMLTYFRAMSLILTMTGEAATHAEKNARLRGAIELIETTVEKLRHQNLESLFDIYRWPDLFRSDWPTRRLMERIHHLEQQLKDLRPDVQSTDETVSDAEPRW
jgi:hypothetical protein